MTRAQFAALVDQAVQEIPQQFQEAMTHVAVVVEDEPPAEVLADLDVAPGHTLFGLYHGTPLPQRGWDYGNRLPDRISIYQGPIEDACRTDEEIRVCVIETVIHEFGHYFGLSEEEIGAIEEQYWRGGANGPA